jgi:hypothetical protein
MNTNDARNEGSNKRQTGNLQMVDNGLWREMFSEKQTLELVRTGLREMRGGHSLMFPVLAGPDGVRMGIVLVAEKDGRCEALHVRWKAEATQVAVLLMFPDQESWQPVAEKFVALWPEQPGMSVRIMDAEGRSMTFPTEGDEG